jgi:hypothetical protein
MAKAEEIQRKSLKPTPSATTNNPDTLSESSPPCQAVEVHLYERVLLLETTVLSFSLSRTW